MESHEDGSEVQQSLSSSGFIGFTHKLTDFIVFQPLPMMAAVFANFTISVVPYPSYRQTAAPNQ
jgi:hypothetical protein